MDTAVGAFLFLLRKLLYGSCRRLLARGAGQRIHQPKLVTLANINMRGVANDEISHRAF
jgi:hypothetical protein